MLIVCLQYFRFFHESQILFIRTYAFPLCQVSVIPETALQSLYYNAVYHFYKGDTASAKKYSEAIYKKGDSKNYNNFYISNLWSLSNIEYESGNYKKALKILYDIREHIEAGFSYIFMPIITP